MPKIHLIFDPTLPEGKQLSGLRRLNRAEKRPRIYSKEHEQKSKLVGSSTLDLCPKCGSITLTSRKHCISPNCN